MNPARPTCERSHRPHAGRLTGVNSAAPGLRWSRSKRTHMRAVPASAGMLAVNAAIRALAVGPVAQLTSRAWSGGRCCTAARAAGGAVATTAAARQAIVACRRMGPLNSRRYPRLRRPAPVSGDLVQRAVAALGRREPPALCRDRPALDAVRVVDDHVDVPVLGRVLGDLVDAGRAHPPPRLGERARDAPLDADVVRRVVARRVARDEDARELVERVAAVGLGIAVLLGAEVHRRLGVRVVRPPPAGDTALRNDHRVRDPAAEEEALAERLLHVARLVEVLADDGVLDCLLVALEVG